MGLQYPYAEAPDGSLVHIDDTDPTPPRPSYTCLSCERELRARYCTDKRDHFYHKVAGDCDPEGYVHRLAKSTFADTYRSCLEEGRPFLLLRTLSGICTRHEQILGIACEASFRQEVDLTKHFDRVDVEANYQGFRADVLLSSSRSPHVLLVEIAVTHTCEPEKIALGARILEINIQTESEALKFKSEVVDIGPHFDYLRDPGALQDETLHSATVYNFKGEVERGDLCQGNCDRQVRVFRLYESGRCEIVGTTPEEWRNADPSDVQFEREFTVPNWLVRKASRDMVREVRRAGFHVVDCYLCEYHGLGSGAAPIFCKIFRKPRDSDAATECSRYQPIPYVQLDLQLTHPDRKNATSRKKRVR